MITLRLNGIPLQDGLALADIDVVKMTYMIEGKEPHAVFDQLLALKLGWTLIISEDEPDTELAVRWEMADITARLIRAYANNKRVIIERTVGPDVWPTNQLDAIHAITEFVAGNEFLPLVVADDSEKLHLGFEPSKVADESPSSTAT